MTTETNGQSRTDWLKAIVVGVILGAVSSVAVTQSQVNSLREDSEKFEIFMLATATAIARIEVHQSTQARELTEIRRIIKEEYENNVQDSRRKDRRLSDTP